MPNPHLHSHAGVGIRRDRMPRNSDYGAYVAEDPRQDAEATEHSYSFCDKRD